MNCTDTRTILPLYADEDLNPEETEAVTEHLATCTSCREQLALDQKLAVALATLTPPSEWGRERMLRARILTEIDRRQSRNWRAVASGAIRRVGATALGVAFIATLIMLLVIVGKPVLEERTAQTVTSLPNGPVLFVDALPGAANYLQMHLVNPATLADVLGVAPIDVGHHFASALRPDGRVLAVFAFPEGSSSAGGALHLIDLTSGSDSAPGVTVHDDIVALTYSLDGKSLYWIVATGHDPVHNLPSGFAVQAYDVAHASLRTVATLHATFAPQDLRVLPRGVLAIYGVPVNADDLAVDAPHLQLIDASSSQGTADLRLPGIKAGQYAENDPANGQVAYRMYRPGVAWDLIHERLYVVSPDTDRIDVVDLTHGRVVQQGVIHPPWSLLERLLHLLAPPVEAKGEPTTMRTAALSPDGRRLYLVRTRGGETGSSTDLDVVDTSDLSVIAYQNLPVSDFALSPDGQNVLLHLWWPPTQNSSGHQALAILNARSLAETGRIIVDSPFSLVGFAPNGRYAYFARNVQLPNGTWEWRTSVVEIRTAQVVAERTGDGSLLLGIWQNGQAN